MGSLQHQSSMWGLSGAGAPRAGWPVVPVIMDMELLTWGVGASGWRTFPGPCVLPDPGRQESFFGPISQSEKCVVFTGVSKIFSKDRKILVCPVAVGMDIPRVAPGWLRVCPPGTWLLSEAWGRERRVTLVSSFHICFPESVPRLQPGRLPGGSRREAVFDLQLDHRMNLPSPFLFPKNNDRFP